MPNHLPFKEKVSNLLNKLKIENSITKKTNKYKYSKKKIDNYTKEINEMSKSRLQNNEYLFN